MNRVYGTRKGFTLTETLIVISIFITLMGIGAYSLVNYRTAKDLDVITDSIAAKLEEAKTNAISGKNGTNFGMAFSTTTYTYWSGSSYNPNSTSNIVYTVPTKFELTSTIPGTNRVVMFSRITGTASATGTVTITYTPNSTINDSITIGTLGDITVIK